MPSASQNLAFEFFLGYTPFEDEGNRLILLAAPKISSISCIGRDLPAHLVAVVHMLLVVSPRLKGA